MTDRDLINAIHNRLDEEPADWQARRELADLLEEQGDLTGAACQRWMIAEQRRPWNAAGAGSVWSWSVSHRPSCFGSELPWPVWAFLPGRQDMGSVCYRTRREAEGELAVALTRAGLIGSAA